MRTYVIRRLLLFIPTLFILSMLVFFSVRLLPGDYIDILLSDPQFVGTDVESHQFDVLDVAFDRSESIGTPDHRFSGAQ